MIADRNARLALCLAALAAWATPAGAQLLGGLTGIGGLPGGPSLPATLGLSPPNLAGPSTALSGIDTGLPRSAAAGGVAARVKTAPPAVPTLPDLSAPVPLIEGSLSAALPVHDGLVDVVDEVAAGAAAETRRAVVRRLLTQHPDLVEADDQGEPVVRGEILGLGIDGAALRRLQRAGFTLRAREALKGLGIETVILGVPRGASASEALRRLRSLDPGGQYDFNHLYQLSGAAEMRLAATPASARAMDGRGLRIGLVDGSVAAGQPSLAASRLVQRGFAAGGAAPTAHATAVASLIAGASGGFHGAAPGATLYVADVYGPTPTGGSAQAVASALAWLAQAKVPVVNISLVGPPNLLLGAAVRALVARGHLVVAAVGNDGPASPPLYPASYPGVVAVTGVDPRRRLLPEASRATHVDFAAPGSEMAAASPGGGFVSVRGTSFAAPIAAGRLAHWLPAPDPAAASRALAALGREAIDLGPPGPDPIYGRGLVGADVRMALGSQPALAARK